MHKLTHRVIQSFKDSIETSWHGTRDTIHVFMSLLHLSTKFSWRLREMWWGWRCKVFSEALRWQPTMCQFYMYVSHKYVQNNKAPRIQASANSNRGCLSLLDVQELPAADEGDHDQKELELPQTVNALIFDSGLSFRAMYSNEYASASPV